MARTIGLFQLASKSPARRGLRILCYHGISLDDEHLWEPMLFMRKETFRSRVELIRKYGFPVLGLEEAVNALSNGSFPDNSVVITIDDGFEATFSEALPLLRESGFPATVYVTSYHVEKATPVFELIVRYMQWKIGDGAFVDLKQLGITTEPIVSRFDSAVVEAIIDFGKSQSTEDERVALTKKIASQLEFDLTSIGQSGAFRLASPRQIIEAATLGTDVQLHTRRHKFPPDETQAKAEITENRRDLEPLVGKQLEHFCYPSGIWSFEVIPWLESLGVRSATTCDPGFNYFGSNPLTLRRFLDSDAISNIEFEAEISGFAEVLRRLRLTLGSY